MTIILLTITGILADSLAVWLDLRVPAYLPRRGTAPSEKLHVT